jgi:hypothetical protein
MRASGARWTDEVPLDQGRLNSSLTSPSSRIFVSDARTPSGKPALKGAILWRGSEDAISSTTPVVQAGTES